MLTHIHLREITDFAFEIASHDLYRYEFTVTFNPKFIFSIDYAHTMLPEVIHDIFQLGCRVSKKKRSDYTNSFLFNYTVEYHKNGYPHIHGTLLLQDPLQPVTCQNWQSKFYRKYGKTDVWATGQTDKIHKNDHFEGPWSQYLKKEGQVTYYRYDQNYFDLTQK